MTSKELLSALIITSTLGCDSGSPERDRPADVYKGDQKAEPEDKRPENKPEEIPEPSEEGESGDPSDDGKAAPERPHPEDPEPTRATPPSSKKKKKKIRPAKEAYNMAVQQRKIEDNLEDVDKKLDDVLRGIEDL